MPKYPLLFILNVLLVVSKAIESNSPAIRKLLLSNLSLLVPCAVDIALIVDNVRDWLKLSLKIILPKANYKQCITWNISSLLWLALPHLTSEAVIKSSRKLPRRLLPQKPGISFGLERCFLAAEERWGAMYVKKTTESLLVSVRIIIICCCCLL